MEVVHLPNSQVNPGRSINRSLETVDIAVHVTDGTNPVSQVEVAIGEITGTTGNAGGCTLRNVPVGEVTITATKTGFEDYEETVTITSETETINITLTEE